MIKDIHRKYFEVWGDEQSQNSILKGLLAFMIVTNIALTVSIVILSQNKPLLISQDRVQTKLIDTTTSLPRDFIEKEIKQSLSRFSKLRYNWNHKDIAEKLQKSSQFVGVDFKRKFLKTNLKNTKTAQKKKITQKFYFSKPIMINASKNEAHITGDRILIVEGLRATQPMTFKINYKFGKRTSQNPEGVYITNETLISSLTH